MKKINVLFIISIICILSMLFISCTVPEPNSDLDDVYYKTWMDTIKDDTLIKNIVIPGSHDSGTIDMNSMYCTQNTTIKQQLNSGVRYFDIRVRKLKDGNLKIFHAGSNGVDFIPILKDIVDFIKNNPSEFLILDFQHFDKDAELNVLESIYKYGLNNYSIKNSTTLSDLDYIDSLSLKDVRGKVLICWGRDKGAEDPITFRRNNDECTLDNCVLDSYYYSKYNKKSSEKYVDEGLKFYYSKYKNKNKGLWVLQGQLTKAGANLYNLEKNHNENFINFVNNLKDNSEYLSMTNIIMRDFIGNDKEKIDNILALNKLKGLLK